MLLEEGFDVVSVDASDKMLKYALKERWNRRSEPAFNKWGTWIIIGEYDEFYLEAILGRQVMRLVRLKFDCREFRGQCEIPLSSMWMDELFNSLSVNFLMLRKRRVNEERILKSSWIEMMKLCVDDRITVHVNLNLTIALILFVASASASASAACWMLDVLSDRDLVRVPSAKLIASGSREPVSRIAQIRLQIAN